MSPIAVDKAAAKAAAKAASAFRDDVERLRSDAGITIPELARAAKISRAHLYRVLLGDAAPSDETRARLGVALGADLSIRLYPNTGPLVRDRHQAQILEALLASLHPRWHAFMEVAVHRPSRGWIDVALHCPAERVIVATEVQSELRRLEQLVRWAGEKAASLPSWDGWARLEPVPAISRLLLVRRTRATQAVAADFARQLRLAYPAHPDDAIAALTSQSAAWAGAALVWVEATATRARFHAGR